MDGDAGDWQKVSLGSVARIERGVTWSKDQERRDCNEGALPVLRIGNVQSTGFRLDDLLYIQGTSAADRARTAITQRTIVMVGSNGNPDRVGNAFLSTRLVVGHLIASFLIRVEPTPGISERFLAAWLRSDIVQSAITNATAGSTGLKNLSLEWLRALTVHLPAEAEQHAIASVLDAIDEAIEKAEAVIEATETLRKALLQELLTRGIPGWHNEWKTVPAIGTIPACWEVVRLGEVAEVQSGIALGAERKANGTPTPYITVAHVGTNRVTVGESLRYMHLRGPELEKRLLAYGDAVMVEGHAQLSQLGRAALVPREADGFAYQNHLFRVRADAQRIFNEFVVTLVNSPVGRNYFAQFGGTTSGLNTVSTSNVRRMALGMPALDEQRRIVNIVAGVDERLEQERQMLTCLRAIKRQTASALLSARVRVPDHERKETHVPHV
ncbi:MAG: restriction endonuclease subunit S [Dehalococcoidia bacterium]|nr:restriction endonuclease subunit S [Dehalococcoidia bacterium]